MLHLRFLAVAALCVTIGRISAAQTLIEEPPRQTPVLYDVDVVVIGGGLSGVGAAVGAARGGARTLLIERTGYLGGWLRGAGLGNVLAIENWRPALTEGLLLDITKKMVELGSEGNPTLEAALKRGDLRVTNHEMLPHAFQSLVVESGAQILYFSTYAGSIMKEGKIEAVLIETPVGRAAVRGKVFIDCTGLATVASASGAPTKKAEALMGLATWIGGVDTARFAEWSKGRPTEASPEFKKWAEGKLGHPITFFSSVDTGDPTMNDFPWDDWLSRNGGLLGEAILKAVEAGDLTLFHKIGEKGKVGIVEGLKIEKFEIAGGIARPRTYVVGVDPTDIRQLSEAHVKSAQLLFEYIRFLNKYVPGFEKAQITRMAEMTLNRAGRSIENDAAPAVGDIEKPIEHDDAIAILRRGAKAAEYEVPYSAMLAKDVSNLLAVGKSSSGGIFFRTHMLSVIMGQAAGNAAAIAVRENVSPRDVPIRTLQAELRKAGIPVPEK